MTFFVLMHLLLAAAGLSVIAAGIAAVTVPQFSRPRTAPRFRLAFAPSVVTS